MTAFRVATAMQVGMAAMAAMLVASCSNEAASDAAGHALDRAAMAQGLLGKEIAPPTGVFERLQGKARDRMCVVGSEEDGWRFAAEWQATDRSICLTGGMIRVSAGENSSNSSDEENGQHWRMRFHGAQGCDIDLLAQSDRLNFPEALPAACAALCDGKIRLAAAQMDRISWSEEEALQVRMRDADGKIRVGCDIK